jgi:hypothetical protein
MTLRVHPRAKAEIRDGVIWFEAKRPGLGDEFVDAVEEGLAEIESHPDRFALLETNRSRREIRRYIPGRFPYTIVNEMRAGETFVLAVAGMSQKPIYWMRRRTPHVPPP